MGRCGTTSCDDIAPGSIKIADGSGDERRWRALEPAAGSDGGGGAGGGGAGDDGRD